MNKGRNFSSPPSLGKRLWSVWSTLISFQKRVYGETWPRDPDMMTQKYVMLLTKEAMEVLDHTSYKDHKPRIDFDNRAAARKEEIADVVIYAMELAAVNFSSPEELIQEIERKIGINEQRINLISSRQQIPVQ